MGILRRGIPATLLAVAALSMMSFAPVQAQALTGLHAKIKVGGNTCMASHRHTGFARSGAGKRSAVQAAVKDWSSFTAMEYGRAWAGFRNAHSRKMSCSRYGTAWSCKVSASPCRRR